ncbi:MAG TPA: DNA methyltransferase [Phycisphaerae bacterium]|nr:DNA methyltransferase [Phycisphaerae bacterium]
MNVNQTDLFPERHPARYGDGPPRKRLFLGTYLARAAGDKRLADKVRDRAHEVLLKWAELESAGELQRRKETELRGEFLQDVFGEALGYTFFSEDAGRWNINPEYRLPTGQVDAAIGLFESGRNVPPRALVELKGPTVNLDRDRSARRTPVQQCWDYLNAVPECPWGVICNYVSFRLYHRDKTPRAFELFTLQDLRQEERFAEFHCVFARDGLLRSALGQEARADRLLIDSDTRQRQVGGELYESYHEHRTRLIEHLCAPPHGKPLDAAIRIAQKLLDRIVFVAFCEDRGLLPRDSIGRAWREVAAFARVTNPRWRNFLSLFRSIDEGNAASGVPPYDGGLFKEDPEVDDLQLDDDWATFFKGIGVYDFRDEVNLDVLGHLFEQSINDLERLRISGLFERGAPPTHAPKMGKSADRKRTGVYYTPPEFTEFITRNTVQNVVDRKLDAVAEAHGLTREQAEAAEAGPKPAAFWRACFQALREVRIVDPACGSGAFLIQAYDVMEENYRTVLHNLSLHDGADVESLREAVADTILHDNLFGVDLSEEAVEITRLALWIRSAQAGRTLADLSANVVCGNSLVQDPQVDPRAVDWAERFPHVFSREGAGFDCVIGNPPWERMKLQEREFFDFSAPKIASAVHAATRRRLVRELEEGNPELHERYLRAKAAAERMLDYARSSGRYPLTGKGDVNTYAVFAELARSIVAPAGRVGLLVPSGIATDHTTREFFGNLVESEALIGLYDFENKKPAFPDVHRSFKFSILFFGGQQLRREAADFAFFCRQVEDLEDKRRHVKLTPKDLHLLNPNTRTCPIFRSRRDAELTKGIYRRVPVLVNEGRKEGGNPWGVSFLRMFDQTNDAELFTTADQLREMGFKEKDGRWRKGKGAYLPLYEAKMVQAYDHRAAGVRIEPGNWMRQGQTRATTPVEHQDADFRPEPRWWVAEEHVRRVLGQHERAAYLCFKDVTSPTNMRTMIAAFIPLAGVLNSAPLVLLDQGISESAAACLLANLNSFALDFVARQKVGGVHLNFYIVQQLPVFPPSRYKAKCPWSSRGRLERWISERVLRLTCTSDDMKPLAQAAGFRERVHAWDEEERADLQAELDAAYFILYGLEREDVEYALSTFSGTAHAGAGVFGPAVSDRILKHYDRLREQCRQ